MLLNLLINYYILKELICRVGHKKIYLEIKHKYARPARFVRSANFVKLRKTSD